MHRSSYVIMLLGLLLILGTALLPLPSPAPTNALNSPSWAALLGTDALGRDVLYRTLLGFGFTLRQATLVLGISLIIGSLAAAISALNYGRWPDQILVLMAETIRSYPTLLLVLMFGAVGVPPMSLFVLYFWIPIWRSFRFELTLQQDEPYVLWVRLLGVSRLRALLSEVFPNVLPRVAPYAAGLLSEIIAAQAAIEFLGFGPPLEQPSLGGILLEAGQLGLRASWVWLPSLAIIIITIIGVAWAVRRYRQAIKWVPIG